MKSAGDMREAFDAYKAQAGRDRLLRLLEHSQDTIYNLCYQVLHHAQEAEDAAQQVFLEILDHLGEIPDGPHFHAWVRQVSLRTALNRRRSERRRWAHEQRAALMNEERDRAPAEDGSPVHEHLLGLGETDRSLLLDYYYEGKKLEALASERGCSTTAAWKRLEKARDALRQSLVTAGALGAVAGMDSVLDAMEPVAAPAGLIKPTVLAKAAALATAGVGGVLLVTGGMSVKAITTISVAVLLAGASLLMFSGLRRAAAPGPTPAASEASTRAKRPKPSLKSVALPAAPLARVPEIPAAAPVFKDVKEFWEALGSALLKVDDPARWSALRALGIPLSDAEFQAAMVKARGTKGRSRFAWSLFDQIVETWTAKDPRGVLAFFMSFPDARLSAPGVQEAMNGRTEAVWKATALWSRREPAAARSYMQARLDAIDQAVQNGAWPPAFNYGFDIRCREIDARANPREFGDKLMREPNPYAESQTFHLLGQVWGELDPQEAIRWGSEVRTPERWWFFESLGRSWARTDPQAALKWARSLFDKTDGNSILGDAVEAASLAHPEIALAMARLDPQTSEATYLAIAKGWAATDPQAAAELLLSRPRTADGGLPGLKGLILEWAKSDDPKIVFDWVLKNATAGDRPALLSSLAAGWVESSRDAAADALALAKGVPAEERVPVLREFGTAWATVDPVRAAAWVLSTEGLMSRALGSQLAVQLGFHGQDNIEWARSLPSGESRDWALYSALTSPRQVPDVRRTIALTGEIEDPGLQNMVNIMTAMRWPRNDFRGLVEWLQTLPEVPPRPAESRRPLENSLAWIDQNFDAFGTREQIFATCVVTAGHSRAEQEEVIRNSRLTASEKDGLMKRVAEMFEKR